MNLTGADPFGQALAPPRFVGAMNVPGPNGARFNASAGMAVLTLDATTVRMHPRTFWIPMFSDFVAGLDSIITAFPLRRTFFIFSGIGLELSDGQVAYFWTHQAGALLQLLQQRGVAISATPRRATGLMTGQMHFFDESRQPLDRQAPSAAALPQVRPEVWAARRLGLIFLLPLFAGMTLSLGMRSPALAATVAGLVLIAAVLARPGHRIPSREQRARPNTVSEYFGAVIITLVLSAIAWAVIAGISRQPLPALAATSPVAIFIFVTLAHVIRTRAGHPPDRL